MAGVSGANQKKASFLARSQNSCYTSIRSPDRPRASRKKAWKRLETFETRCDTGKDFFIWIRCNPLKGPDSDEKNQGNPSDFIGFAWFYLALLARL
jgi:hypothetical protein